MARPSKKLLDQRKAYAEQVKIWRMRIGCTQAEYAKQSGVSRRTLSKVENGENVNMISLLRIIAYAEQKQVTTERPAFRITSRGYYEVGKASRHPQY